MRSKTLILLLLALGCGLVASVGISQMMENRGQAPAPQLETEKIFVAKKDIKVNEPLNPQNINLEDWPKSKVPADAVRDLAELEGQRAGGSILAGEPIRKGRFASDKRMEEIPSGYRVVAVPADAVSATGHLLQPGDRVDVIVYVTRNAQAGIEQPVAKTVLQDVRVFAVNEQWRPSEDKSAESISARTVSLLVTPDQVELVTLAAEMGRIRLVLRHPDDNVVAQTDGKGAKDLFGTSEEADRDKEWGTEKDNTSGGSGLLSLLQGQPQQPATSAVEPTPAPAMPSDEEFFTMELLKGEEISRVEFTRKGKDGRWRSDASGGGAVEFNEPTPPVSTIDPLPAGDGTSGDGPPGGNISTDALPDGISSGKGLLIGQ